MAKTRAQRKAERRRREQQAQRRQGASTAREREEEAQEATQTGVSGEVAEAEAVIQTGARPEDYGEHTVDRPQEQADGSSVPCVIPETVRPETEPEAPAPSRADVGQPGDAATTAPAEPGESRRERRAREKEERRKSRGKELQRKQTEKPEKRRGPVLGFLASCWAELKRVQWPDRDTLVQASAVTLIFVAVLAAYLGGLDAIFNWLVQRIL